MSRLGGRCYGCGGGSGGSAEETPNTAMPTATVTMNANGPLGRILSAEVRVSPAAGNQLLARADGLFVDSAGGGTPVVETPNAGGVTATAITTATGTLNRQILASVRVSAAANNQLQPQADGLYVPPSSGPALTCTTVKALFASGTPVQVLGEDSAGNCVKGAITVSVTPEAINSIFNAPITVAQVFGVNASGQLGRGVVSAGGSETANSGSTTPSVITSVSGALGRQISANVRISSVAGNQLQQQADGLYVESAGGGGGPVTVDCNSVRALYTEGYVDQIQGVSAANACTREAAGAMLQRLLVASTFSFSNIVTAGEVSGLQVRATFPGSSTPTNLPGFIIPLEAVRDCNNNLLGYFVQP